MLSGQPEIYSAGMYNTSFKLKRSALKRVLKIVNFYLIILGPDGKYGGKWCKMVQ